MLSSLDSIHLELTFFNDGALFLLRLAPLDSIEHEPLELALLLRPALDDHYIGGLVQQDHAGHVQLITVRLHFELYSRVAEIANSIDSYLHAQRCVLHDFALLLRRTLGIGEFTRCVMIFMSSFFKY